MTTVTAVMMRLRSIRRVLRLRPFDQRTEEGRSAERYRRALLTSASSLLARIATVGAALVTVPMTVAYLGEERYGLWLTIGTLLAFAYVADLGVTQGLQTAIARASGRDDEPTAIRYVSTACAVLLATTAAGTVVLAISFWLVPWHRVFNVHSEVAIAEAAPAAIAFGLGWLANILLGVVTRVNDGYQDGVVNNIWQVVGSLLGLAGVYIGIRAELGLPSLMLLFVGGPIVANLINGVILFGIRRTYLRPRWAHVDRTIVPELIGTGFWFLAAGMSHAVVQLMSTLVLAQTMTSAEVPEYGIPARVAAVGGLLLALVAQPLWPAYAEALARGDHPWVRRTMRRVSMFMLVAGLGFGAGFVLVGRPLVEWWVDDAVSPSWSMLAGLGTLTVIVGFENVLATFLSANNAMRTVGLLWIASAIVGVPFMIGFVRWFGVDGVPWALVLTSASCRVVPAAFFCRRILESL